MPDTFNDDKSVIVFDNVLKPETFNDDKHVVLFCKVVDSLTYKEPNEVLLKIVVDVALILDIFKI